MYVKCVAVDTSTSYFLSVAHDVFRSDSTQTDYI